MIYPFICDKEDGGCGHNFTIKCSMDEIGDKKVSCPECKKRKPVRRDYAGQNVSFFGPNVTVGSLADKNSAIMSDDQKHAIKEQNRTGTKLEYTGPVKEGAEVVDMTGDD